MLGVLGGRELDNAPSSRRRWDRPRGPSDVLMICGRRKTQNQLSDLPLCPHQIIYPLGSVRAAAARVGLVGPADWRRIALLRRFRAEVTYVRDLLGREDMRLADEIGARPSEPDTGFLAAQGAEGNRP
jgi:hypothetical protein